MHCIQDDITKMELGVFQLPEYAAAAELDEQAVRTAVVPCF
jgi:hypothetical protein